MDVRTLRPAVARLFRPQLPGSTRTVRVAVEQELFAMGLFSGASVAPERVREASAGRWYAPWLSFEPGGQVEISLPSAPSPDAAARHLVEVTAALGRDLQPHSVVLDARPVRRCDPATPRHLRTPRYDAMEHHLDTIGPAGRRMMRSTASTQACLDWWPGAAGIEQWRVLLLAGPFLAAATARSTGPDGRLTTWLAVDPARTAFDDRLLHGDDPVAAYASFAAGATDFLGASAEAHLSTLFPPVRPRGRYLEVRFPDARPAREVGDLLHGLAALLYDDERRRAALASLSGERARLAEHWADAAAGCCDADRGLALLTGSRRRVAA
ncbi:glutamate-cysteine ligase family protein [Nocardioides sp. QY071]|uniref:glutamate-cysteine ligase family protein n=1 Tax=Nocardioides sp. QY071 TaxID=3044187 RepID=UPI00249C2136|nr:glutamate-cysteine ligase family protein [Nocardioides sp. QY071]WGY02654.1 glutamate-cysteine ligase family protein [Nocardioides sp. QY071]